MKNIPIGSGTGQHLVDTEDMEGVHTDPQMEGVLSRGLGDILVRTDTSCFQSFTGQLLILIGDEMATEGEFIDRGTFPSQVENTNLITNGYLGH